jgi:hypothetical protein
MSSRVKRTDELERETRLELATSSLEGRDACALWHRAQRPEHQVSSYRVYVTRKIVTEDEHDPGGRLRPPRQALGVEPAMRMARRTA